MIPSGLDIAVSLAHRGARVLYVCEHRTEIPDVLHCAEAMPVVESVRRANGLQEIRTVGGGRVIVRAPHASIRGYSFDAVFAPPLVWGDEARKVDLIISTNGSSFFSPLKPPLYSTLQRIAG